MKPTSDYLIGYSIGLPFYAIHVILLPYLKMDGNYSFVTISTIAMTVVDIAADLYVVKCTPGGLFLIGLATTAGYVAACLVALSHFFLRKTIFHFSLKDLQWAQGAEMIRSGITTGITKLSTTVCGVIVNNMLAVFAAGEVIAAFGVGNQVLKFCFCFWLGAASTLMSFTSMLVGEEDSKSLESVQRIAIRHSLRITCIAAALIFIFSSQIAVPFVKNGDPSVISMADVMGMSRIAIAFAMENGIAEDRAKLLSLAVEEMAGNIVQHGFTDGRPHTINIRMLIKDDELILRLRDDCRRFDPIEKYRTDLQFDEDPERGMAIRMMIKLTKEIKYTGLFGMNNLIIRV